MDWMEGTDRKRAFSIAAGPRALAYNPAENAVLVQTDVDGGSYELYMVPKDSAGRDVAPVGLGFCWLEFGACRWGPGDSSFKVLADGPQVCFGLDSHMGAAGGKV
jgi:hypothetical protein